MCVIMVMKDKLISKDALKKCEDANKDGGGVSWVEGDKVHWKKGIDSNEIWDIITKVQLPIVAHFRIGTVGGNTKGLTHPFPITKDCSLALEGTAERVLHHNGHWTQWEDTCMKMVMYHKAYFPLGAWSDSRAMAWMVHQTNQSILRFTGGKVVIHGAKAIHTYGTFEEIDGVFFSNDNWVRKYTVYEPNNDWQSYGGYGYRGNHRCGFKWSSKTDKADKAKAEQSALKWILTKNELTEVEKEVMKDECGDDPQLEAIWLHNYSQMRFQSEGV